MGWRRASAFRTVAVTAVALLTAAGCTSSAGTSDNSSEPPLPTAPLFSAAPTSAVPTTVPAAASTSASADLDRLTHRRVTTWPTVRDRASSATFLLPQVVPPTDRTTNGIRQRLYTVQVTPTTGISVGFSQAGSAANVQGLLAGYLDSIAQQFQGEGVTDAKILEKRSFRIGALPAVSGRIYFTPKQAPAIPVVWFVQAVASRNDLVVAQTVTFPLTRSPSYPVVSRALQAKLVAGLHLR